VTTPSIKDRAEDVVDEVMTTAHGKVPFFSHAVAMIKHFGQHQGSVLAGGVTYFGFLSFFPILALTFAVVGILSHFYSGVQDWVQKALDQVLPGLIGTKTGQIDITSITQRGGGAISLAAIIGALGLLYTGLGYMSALATSLQAMFELPQREKRNFVVGKFFDLITLVAVGVTLVASVAVTGFVTGFSHDIVDWLGFPYNAWVKFVLWVLTVLLGVAASTVLFLTIYKLLGKPDLPNRALVGGAALAAIGFEILKIAAAFLIANASKSPAAAVAGVSLVLLVWINYFARLTLYGAAWAATGERAGSAGADEATSPALVEARSAALEARVVQGTVEAVTEGDNDRDTPVPVGERVAFATGAIVGAALAGVVAHGISHREGED
jgi:membrane protein